MRICLILGNFRQQKGVGISSKISVRNPSFSHQKLAGKKFCGIFADVWSIYTSTQPLPFLYLFGWYRHCKPQEISAKPGPNLVPPALDRIRLHGEGEWSLAGHWMFIAVKMDTRATFFGEEISSWSILMFFVFGFLNEIAHLTSGQFESFEEVLVNLTSTALRIGQKKTSRCSCILTVETGHLHESKEKSIVKQRGIFTPNRKPHWYENTEIFWSIKRP